MSTRKAKDDSVFYQARYASSPEFERGLIANLVAKRAAILDNVADRELVWFIQYLSHQADGLAAVAQDLIARYADKIQTAAMVQIGVKPGKTCSAEQVKMIRREIPLELRMRFLLNYEKDALDVEEPSDFCIEDLLADASFRRALSDDSGGVSDSVHKKNIHPASYPAQVFFDLCRAEADGRLENFLCEMCLNPAVKLASGPWYFPGLIETLRQYQADFIAAKSSGVFVTALGKKVFDVLDYTVYGRGLTLMQGEARLGKSHAARAWCQQHPGHARFVEVPSGNDEATFFRDLARGLGLGNFLNYKVVQIRERVESVLLTGHLILVLDEAQRLWPQTNFREGYPKRIVWVMTMANAGVPIAMVATPQFFATQKVVEKNGWNSAQLTGRISHYEPLPADLSPDDLMAVAKSVLPEANVASLRALAVYARSSARYLAAIDSIAKRARYIALRDGRAAASTDDVRRAMQESVIPADTKLQQALSDGRKSRTPQPPRMHVEPAANLLPPPRQTDLESPLPQPNREPGTRQNLEAHLLDA